VFAEDARVDYTAAGGVAGSWRELLEWLRGAMAPFSAWQHLLSNIVVEIDGDFARARTECYNPLARADGSVLHVGCHYLDRLRRDPAGWRIVERRLGVTWMDERPRAG
jgi:hypothetical protein